MKRIIYIALILSLCFAPIAFAWDSGSSSSTKQLYTYTIKNTAGTYLTTVIPTTTIIPGSDRILGYSIQGNSASSENVIAVYDETSGTLSGEALGEAEAPANACADRWFPYPRLIKTGVTVRQGPNTLATIYFEK